MSVDGVGRSGGAGGASGAGPVLDGVDGAGGVEAPKVTGAEATSAQSSEAVSASSPLAQLQRGEIDVERYLDVRVESAVSPYVGRVSGEQLEFMKGALRDALSTDPVVAELLRRTTGRVPSPSE